MRYTIPQLHAFGNDTKHGECGSGTRASACSSGSSDYQQCAFGSAATSGCNTGNSPSYNCQQGNSAKYDCYIGNQISGSSHGV